MIVVSDTSPITNLVDIGHLELLRTLFGVVLVPREVFRELAAGAIALPEWIEVRDVHDRTRVADLESRLDLGEAEVLVLAIETRANLVLVDERRGRTVAKGLGVRTIGVLGILLRAKSEGHINAVAPLLDELIHTAGFYVSAALRAQTLRLARERDA